MKKEVYMSWDTYFMAIAVLSSYRSKDGKTQNGACVVGGNNRIIGIGYNGLPRGCDDNDPDFWADDNDSDRLRSKHTYVVHAEKNAIYNCLSHDLDGAVMYSTQFPCNTCAQAIIQVGIQSVIYLREKPHHADLNQAVMKMFRSAGVRVLHYDSLDVDDPHFLDILQSAAQDAYSGTRKPLAVQG